MVTRSRSGPPPTGTSDQAHLYLSADPDPEGGSVTVEAAVALAAIVLVLAMCLAGIGCLITALRVTDAAGEAARLAARGEPAAARAVVEQLAPDGSVLTLSVDDDLVTAALVAAPLGGLLPTVRISAVAVAAVQGAGR